MPVTFLCMLVEKSHLSFPEMVRRTSGKIDKKDAETSNPKIHLSPPQPHFMLSCSVWARFRSQSRISWVNISKSTHSWSKNLAPNIPCSLTSWKHMTKFDSSKIHCTCWCEGALMAWSPYSSKCNLGCINTETKYFEIQWTQASLLLILMKKLASSSGARRSGPHLIHVFLKSEVCFTISASASERLSLCHSVLCTATSPGRFSMLPSCSSPGACGAGKSPRVPVSAHWLPTRSHSYWNETGTCPHTPNETKARQIIQLALGMTAGHELFTEATGLDLVKRSKMKENLHQHVSLLKADNGETVGSCCFRCPGKNSICFMIWRWKQHHSHQQWVFESSKSKGAYRKMLCKHTAAIPC